jgi:hypothetical protein
MANPAWVKGGKSPNPGGRPKQVVELLMLARENCPKALAFAIGLLDEAELAKSPKTKVAQRKIKLEAAKLIISYGMGAPPKVSEEDMERVRKSALDSVSVETLEALAQQPIEPGEPDEPVEH